MLVEYKAPGGSASKYPRVTEYDIHSVTTASAEELGPIGVANPIGRRNAVAPRACNSASGLLGGSRVPLDRKHRHRLCV